MNILLITKTIDIIKKLDQLIIFDLWEKYDENSENFTTKLYDIIITDDWQIAKLKQQTNAILIAYTTIENLPLFNNIDDFIINPSSQMSIITRIKLWIHRLNNKSMIEPMNINYSLLIPLIIEDLNKLSLQITDDNQSNLIQSIDRYISLMKVLQPHITLVDYYNIYDQMRINCIITGIVYNRNMSENDQAQRLNLLLLILLHNPTNINITDELITIIPKLTNPLLINYIQNIYNYQIEEYQNSSLIKL